MSCSWLILSELFSHAVCITSSIHGKFVSISAGLPNLDICVIAPSCLLDWIDSFEYNVDPLSVVRGGKRALFAGSSWGFFVSFFRYFFSLPYILGKACAVKVSSNSIWSQIVSLALAVSFFIVIEYSFSYTFPSTPFSSTTLCIAHLALLGMIYRQPASRVYMMPEVKVD